jgi:hypothetical protein
LQKNIKYRRKIMAKLNKKSTDAIQKPGLSAQDIVESETAVNEPMKSRKYFGLRDSSLIITIGGLHIEKDGSHKPKLMVDFYDWETIELAKSKKIELDSLFIGPSDDIIVESFFRKHLGDPLDEIGEDGLSTELFSPVKIFLPNGKNQPFKRSRDENGIRYLKPIIEKIKNLPDDCENKGLMKWFKFWSEKAVEKYGDDACIQFQDFPKECGTNE